MLKTYQKYEHIDLFLVHSSPIFDNDLYLISESLDTLF